MNTDDTKFLFPSFLYVKSQVFIRRQTDSFLICFMALRNLQNQSSISRHCFAWKKAAFLWLCFEVWVRSLAKSRRDLRPAAGMTQRYPRIIKLLRLASIKQSGFVIALPQVHTPFGSSERTGRGLKAFWQYERWPLSSSYDC